MKSFIKPGGLQFKDKMVLINDAFLMQGGCRVPFWQLHLSADIYAFRVRAVTGYSTIAK